MMDSTRTLEPAASAASPPPATAPRSAGRSLLLAAIVGLALFGAALVLLPGPIVRLFGWIAYGHADRVASFGPDAVAYVRLVHAILGAMTVGWALTMLAVVAWLWRLNPARAWLALAAPAAVWFVLDSGYSLASGFWRNVVFNALFAAAFAVPLLLMRPAGASTPRGDRDPASRAPQAGARP